MRLIPVIAALVKEGAHEQQAKAAVLELLAQREDARVRARTVDLCVAPNCQPDVLSSPPRVVTIEGRQFLQLKGFDGWEAEGAPVLEVTRMAAHGGLVLVATPEQVFLMTAEDFDHPIE